MCPPQERRGKNSQMLYKGLRFEKSVPTSGLLDAARRNQKLLEVGWAAGERARGEGVVFEGTTPKELTMTTSSDLRLASRARRWPRSHIGRRQEWEECAEEEGRRQSERQTEREGEREKKIKRPEEI